jgi:hypothetical protein
MNSKENKLHEEVRRGKTAQHVYDIYIKEHINIAVSDIYTNIELLSISETEKLIEFKRLLASIRGLERAIFNDIETGKLAQKQLENNDEYSN